jgi:hypothetical protein
MSVRRGPTERRRSEGTLTKEGPNQEQAPLVTWGAFPSNSPKAKPEAVRPTREILIQKFLRKTTNHPAPSFVFQVRRIHPRHTNTTRVYT